MPHPRKFSDFELGERLRQGKGVTEIAREFGVNKGSVSRRINQLKLGFSKNVTLHHAGEIVKKEINAAEQLLKINATANQLLDMLMKIVEGVSSKDEKDRACAFDELEHVSELLGGKSGVLDAAIKIKAEIRQQLNLQLNIFQSLYDMEAVAAFQREVLEIIGNVSPAVRDNIVEALSARGSIRSALGWS